MADNIPDSILLACCDQMGMSHTAIATTQLIQRFRPRLIAMCGIAGGVPASGQAHGDLLLSTFAIPYRSGRMEPNGLKPDGHTAVVDKRVEPLLRAAAKELARTPPPDRYAARGGLIPKAHFGPIGTADQVVDDASIVEALRGSVARKLLGVEMEIFAFYSACAWADPVPYYFACKAISDFPGKKKKTDATKNVRADAAFVSGWFAAQFIATNWLHLEA